ncbi:MAG: hypothetical protein ABFC30_02070 [Proteiniphilum sp.]
MFLRIDWRIFDSKTTPHVGNVSVTGDFLPPAEWAQEKADMKRA